MGLDIYFHRVHKAIEEVGYFRKVNFLVAFFENQLGKEVRNCEGVPVSKEDVEELKDRCEKVLADHTKAEELLPTQGGFFFGDIEYDDYYFEDVQQVLDYTKELLPQFEDLEDDEYIEFYIWY